MTSTHWGLISLGIFIVALFVAILDSRSGGLWLDVYDDNTHVAQRSGLNLNSGDNITVTSADDPSNQRVSITIGVDDDFLLNTGDVGTGVYDFGGATSFELPNGANPTVDTVGEIALDTTDDQIVYLGASTDTPMVLTRKKHLSFVLESPADADNFLLIRVDDSILWHHVYCIIDPDDSGESVVIDFQERDATGDNPVSIIGTTITCDNDGAYDDTLANATVDAGDWLSHDIGTVTGTVTQLIITAVGEVVRE